MKLRFGTKSAFQGEFVVVEEEKTHHSDQEAMCTCVLMLSNEINDLRNKMLKIYISTNRLYSRGV